MCQRDCVVGAWCVNIGLCRSVVCEHSVVSERGVTT